MCMRLGSRTEGFVGLPMLGPALLEQPIAIDLLKTITRRVTQLERADTHLKELDIRLFTLRLTPSARRAGPSSGTGAV